MRKVLQGGWVGRGLRQKLESKAPPPVRLLPLLETTGSCRKPLAAPSHTSAQEAQAQRGGRSAQGHTARQPQGKDDTLGLGPESTMPAPPHCVPSMPVTSRLSGVSS